MSNVCVFVCERKRKTEREWERERVSEWEWLKECIQLRFFILQLLAYISRHLVVGGGCWTLTFLLSSWPLKRGFPIVSSKSLQMLEPLQSETCTHFSFFFFSIFFFFHSRLNNWRLRSAINYSSLFIFTVMPWATAALAPV